MLSEGQRMLVEEHLWLAEAAICAVSLHPGLQLERCDLLGEAYLALCEAALRWDSSRGKFSTYAWMRVRGAVLDAWRRGVRLSLRHTALADGLLAGSGADGELEREDLAMALALLPPRWRAVVELSFFGEFGTGEVARLLGISVSRVSQIKREALKRLKAILSG